MFLKNILLLYQLENYNSKRFLLLLLSKPWLVFSKKRQKLDFTKKIILLIFVWIFLLIIIIFSFGVLFQKSIVILFTFFLVTIFSPVLLVFSDFLISPIDIFLKKKMVSNAKQKIWKHSDLLIIWITWSYWKTSQKEILKTILGKKYRILETEWNKNTPLWISEVILKNDLEKFDVFIVEMGAYKKWDIKELCEIVKPKIWILTWITEQHLERFWNLDNIIEAKFELIESLPIDWMAIIDGTNINIKKWFQIKKDNLRVKNIVKIPEPKNLTYLPNFWWISFDYDWNKVQTKLLWWFSAKLIASAFEIGKYLNLNVEEILWYARQIGYISHRLELIYNPISNLYIIDDSYNWNFEWVKAAIELFSEVSTNWRKVYLTPWLVELWEKTQEINKEVWKVIAKNFNIVMLIKSKSSEYVRVWLLESWFDVSWIIYYNSALEAHEDLKNILKSWDSIIFQNDITDNYI